MQVGGRWWVTVGALVTIWTSGVLPKDGPREELKRVSQTEARFRREASSLSESGGTPGKASGEKIEKLRSKISFRRGEPREPGPKRYAEEARKNTAGSLLQEKETKVATLVRGGEEEGEEETYLKLLSDEAKGEDGTILTTPESRTEARFYRHEEVDSEGRIRGQYGFVDAKDDFHVVLYVTDSLGHRIRTNTHHLKGYGKELSRLLSTGAPKASIKRRIDKLLEEKEGASYTSHDAKKSITSSSTLTEREVTESSDVRRATREATPDIPSGPEPYFEPEESGSLKKEHREGGIFDMPLIPFGVRTLPKRKKERFDFGLRTDSEGINTPTTHRPSLSSYSTTGPTSGHDDASFSLGIPAHVPPLPTAPLVPHDSSFSGKSGKFDFDETSYSSPSGRDSSSSGPTPFPFGNGHQDISVMAPFTRHRHHNNIQNDDHSSFTHTTTFSPLPHDQHTTVINSHSFLNPTTPYPSSTPPRLPTSNFIRSSSFTTGSPDHSPKGSPSSGDHFTSPSFTTSKPGYVSEEAHTSSDHFTSSVVTTTRPEHSSGGSSSSGDHLKSFSFTTISPEYSARGTPSPIDHVTEPNFVHHQNNVVPHIPEHVPLTNHRKDHHFSPPLQLDDHHSTFTHSIKSGEDSPSFPHDPGHLHLRPSSHSASDQPLVLPGSGNHLLLQGDISLRELLGHLRLKPTNIGSPTVNGIPLGRVHVGSVHDTGHSKNAFMGEGRDLALAVYLNRDSINTVQHSVSLQHGIQSPRGHPAGLSTAIPPTGTTNDPLITLYRPSSHRFTATHTPRPAVYDNEATANPLNVLHYITAPNLSTGGPSGPPLRVYHPHPTTPVPLGHRNPGDVPVINIVALPFDQDLPRAVSYEDAKVNVLLPIRKPLAKPSYGSSRPVFINSTILLTTPGPQVAGRPGVLKSRPGIPRGPPRDRPSIPSHSHHVHGLPDPSILSIAPQQEYDSPPHPQTHPPLHSQIPSTPLPDHHKPTPPPLPPPHLPGSTPPSLPPPYLPGPVPPSLPPSHLPGPTSLSPFPHPPIHFPDATLPPPSHSFDTPRTITFGPHPHPIPHHSDPPQGPLDHHHHVDSSSPLPPAEHHPHHVDSDPVANPHSFPPNTKPPSIASDHLVPHTLGESELPKHFPTLFRPHKPSRPNDEEPHLTKDHHLHAKPPLPTPPTPPPFHSDSDLTFAPHSPVLPDVHQHHPNLPTTPFPSIHHNDEPLFPSPPVHDAHSHPTSQPTFLPPTSTIASTHLGSESFPHPQQPFPHHQTLPHDIPSAHVSSDPHPNHDPQFLDNSVFSHTSLAPPSHIPEVPLTHDSIPHQPDPPFFFIAATPIPTGDHRVRNLPDFDQTHSHPHDSSPLHDLPPHSQNHFLSTTPPPLSQNSFLPHTEEVFSSTLPQHLQEGHPHPSQHPHSQIHLRPPPVTQHPQEHFPSTTAAPHLEGHLPPSFPQHLDGHSSRPAALPSSIFSHPLPARLMSHHAIVDLSESARDFRNYLLNDSRVQGRILQLMAEDPVLLRAMGFKIQEKLNKGEVLHEKVKDS